MRLAVVRRDDLGVGDDAAREQNAERLAHRIHRAAEDVPFAPPALDAVDVDGRRDPLRAQQREDERVRGVADQDRVEVAAQRVERGEEGVGDGLEVLAADGGEDDALYAVPVIM